MSEFSGFPLVAGSVHGVRAFDVDQLGRLRGVSHRQVWVPGENVADCKKSVVTREEYESVGDYAPVTTWSRSVGGRPYPVFRDPRSSLRIEGDPHDIADCDCGFYAYYSGDSSYASPGRVDAVIEGYGPTTVGTRGFRCSRARIVALSVEDATASDGAPDRVHWLRAIRLPLIGVALGAASTTAALVNDTSWVRITIGVGLVLLNLFIGLLLLGREVDRYETAEKARDSERSGLSAEAVQRLRRNYPDVPFYTSRDAMLAAHPTSRGDEPTPETDPEFWTRSAS